jgi:hypothetical protein
MALSKPIKMPAKESGESSTSNGRLYSRSATASHFGAAASGLFRIFSHSHTSDR